MKENPNDQPESPEESQKVDALFDKTRTQYLKEGKPIPELVEIIFNSPRYRDFKVSQIREFRPHWIQKPEETEDK